VSNKTLIVRAALAKPWSRKSRSCAGSLKPQLVASQECNVAEERAAMPCHNKISRKKQDVAKRTAEK